MGNKMTDPRTDPKIDHKFIIYIGDRQHTTWLAIEDIDGKLVLSGDMTAQQAWDIVGHETFHNGPFKEASYYPEWFLIAIALAMWCLVVMAALGLIGEYRLKGVRMKRVLLQEIEHDKHAALERRNEASK
jgi:hypothetical protein